MGLGAIGTAPQQSLSCLLGLAQLAAL